MLVVGGLELRSGGPASTGRGLGGLLVMMRVFCLFSLEKRDNQRRKISPVPCFAIYVPVGLETALSFGLVGLAGL